MREWYKKYSFADNRLGQITSIDVSNPLKALIFTVILASSIFFFGQYPTEVETNQTTGFG